MKPSTLASFGIRPILGLTALGLAAVSVTGCGASTQYEALSADDAARPAREARTVEVRFNAPSRAHREAGLITASASKLEDLNERDFARALRAQGAEKGCDGIIISDGSRHTGSLAVLDADRPFYRAVCIVYPDGKGADPDTLAQSNGWIDGNAPREQAVVLSPEAPPSSCTAVGTIRTDTGQPTEGAKRALFRRRAREKKANYVQLQSTSFTSGDNGGEAAAYACPADVAAKAAPPKEG